LRKEIAALKLQLESGGVAPAAAPGAAPAEGAAAASSPPPAPAAAAAAASADGDSTAAAAPPPAPTAGAAPEGAPVQETVAIEVVPDELKKAFKNKQDRARATAALEAVSKDPVKAAALQKALEESTDGTAQIEPAPGDGEDEKGKKKKGGGGRGEPITVNKSCVNITKTAAAAPGFGPERIVIQKEVGT